jgi:hypothetical protein
VVVAVITVRVVQATADKVIDVIAVRHALVSTGWAMYVTCAALPWSALRRICGARLDDMLIDVVSVRMMQVPIMQVVDMIAVTDGSMTASRTMLMRMVCVCGARAGRHGRPPLSYSHSSGRATVDADGHQEFESKEKLAGTHIALAVPTSYAELAPSATLWTAVLYRRSALRVHRRSGTLSRT